MVGEGTIHCASRTVMLSIAGSFAFVECPSSQDEENNDGRDDDERSASGVQQ
jgi:hypothetical protein